MSEAAKLTRGSIRGHLVQQTAPMIIGVAAIMSIGLVDAYFIGQLGPVQLAAIAFIFPVSVALTSMGVGISVGINSVVARTLGAGDRELAVQRANVGVLFALACGFLAAALLYFALDPLFNLMQANEEQLPFIRTYMQPFALGFPLLMAIMGLNGVLRGQGAAKLTSYVSITYAAANWVLDPILITGAFGFEGFGIAGAAYATIAGWSIAVVLGFTLLARTDLPFQPLTLGALGLIKIGHAIRTIATVAAPASFSNAINPIGLAVLTALIATQGEAAVAGFGAAGRLQSFAVVPLLGLSASIGAIVGQNWGANLPDRSRLAVRWAFGYCIVYGLAIALVLVFGARWFAGFFSDDPQIIYQFRDYLTVAAWGYAGFGLLIVSNGALNAVDRSNTALFQSAARVFLVMLPVAYLLRGVLDADAIYVAELTANLIGGAVAAIIVIRVLKAGKLDKTS